MTCYHGRDARATLVAHAWQASIAATNRPPSRRCCRSQKPRPEISETAVIDRRYRTVRVQGHNARELVLKAEAGVAAGTVVAEAGLGI